VDLARTDSSALVLVALSVAFAVSACGGASKPPEASKPEERATSSGSPRKAAAPSDTDQIESLLAARAEALGRGDAQAYAATATGAQRVRDHRAARRTRGLGVVRTRFAPSSMTVGRRRADLRGRSVYGLSGLTGRFSGARRLVAVKTRTGWRIARESSRRERHPWELGRFTRTRSDHFVVLAPAGLALGDLTGTLEAGYGALRTALRSGRLRRRYLVVVAGSAAQATRLTRGIRGVKSLAAITDSHVRESGPALRPDGVVSQRLVIVWPTLRDLDPESRVRIVTHELAHAALAGVTSGRTPSWLVEGIALFASGDRRVAEAASELTGPRPPSLARLEEPDAIARLSGARQGESYALASAAAHYLVERFGQADLLRLYESFNDETILGNPGESTTIDRALRKTLGISLRRLERDLRRWVLTSA